MVCIPSAAKSWHKQHSHFILLALFAFACSTAFMYWVTAQGPGVSPDSVTYIEAAQSLLAGRGFYVNGQPVTHYPPGYPLLIAAVDWLHPGNTIQAARLVAVFFYSTNLVLVGLAVYLCTNASITAAICAMLVFLSSAHMISVHAMAWSEAPFIAFCMSSIILFSLYIMNLRPLLLVLASVMVGFAAATRYIGVVLFPTIALAFLLIDKREVKFRAKDALICAAIAFSGVFLFIVRNIAVDNSATNRELIIHLANFNHIKELIISISDFIFPVEILLIAKIMFLLIISCFLLLSAKKGFPPWRKSLTIGLVFLFNCIIYIIIYITFVFVSISFFDYHILLDKRILSPVVTVGFASTVLTGWFFRNKSDQFYVWKIFIYSIFFYIGINAIAAMPTAVDFHKNGYGYTSRYVNNLVLIKIIPFIPKDRVIYSNGNDIINFLTERKAVMLPEKKSPGTMQLNKNYKEKINHIVKECREGKALIVYFNAIGWRWYLPTAQELESLADLPVLFKNEDGVIYGKKN